VNFIMLKVCDFLYLTSMQRLPDMCTKFVFHQAETRAAGSLSH